MSNIAPCRESLLPNEVSRQYGDIDGWLDVEGLGEGANDEDGFPVIVGMRESDGAWLSDGA